MTQPQPTPSPGSTSGFDVIQDVTEGLTPYLLALFGFVVVFVLVVAGVRLVQTWRNKREVKHWSDEEERQRQTQMLLALHEQVGGRTASTKRKKLSRILRWKNPQAEQTILNYLVDEKLVETEDERRLPKTVEGKEVPQEPRPSHQQVRLTSAGQRAVEAFKRGEPLRAPDGTVISVSRVEGPVTVVGRDLKGDVTQNWSKQQERLIRDALITVERALREEPDALTDSARPRAMELYQAAEEAFSQGDPQRASRSLSLLQGLLAGAASSALYDTALTAIKNLMEWSG